MFEVDILERRAPAVPAIGTAAEKSEPAGIEAGVLKAHALALIESLRAGVAIISAALQKTDPRPRSGEREREADAGGTGSNDADVEFEIFGCRRLAEIQEHVFIKPPVSRAGRPSCRRMPCPVARRARWRASPPSWSLSSRRYV